MNALPPIQGVVAAAEEAGRIIQRVRATMGPALEKGDASPVTEADHAADAYLRQTLLALAPVGWLSEETVDDPVRLGQSRVWIVDPLDGTKEFISGVPQYSVAIALITDGVPDLGVVHNPSTGETVAAVRGGGTTLNGRPVRVAEGTGMLASRTEVRNGEFAPFEGEWEISAVGSIEYKLALVASGQHAVTLSRGPKHEWDVCAGALLVTEAGGLVTDLFGQPLRFNQPFPKVPGILAGAPRAWQRAADRLAQVGASSRMDELAGRPHR